MNDSRPVIGWREWISLPDHGISAMKVKVDTGARTSSLHAEHIEIHDDDGVRTVRFTCRPWQRSDADAVTIELPLLSEEQVRSSNGAVELRPVVALSMRLSGVRWQSPVTLTDRSDMGFRMLLGRTSMAGRFLVDPSASYLAGRATPELRRRNRGKSPA